MSEISIPGDPGGLSALGTQLRAAAGEIDGVGRRVGADGLRGSWSGGAAEAFRSSVEPLPGQLSDVSAAFEEAAQALQTFASRLSELQEKARWYERQIDQARAEQNSAQARQRQAESELNAARRRHSVATDPAVLHAAKMAVYYGEGRVSQAFSEVEQFAEQLTRLTAATVTLRAEYEQAVSACCGALGDARRGGSSPLAGISNALFGALGGVGAFAGVIWRSGGKFARGAAENAHTLLDLVDRVIEEEVPVGRLGRWATPFVRIANDGRFKWAGRGFLALGVVEGALDVERAYSGARGQGLVGRLSTAGFVAARDGALLHPAVGGADFVTDGVLSADMEGIRLIGGTGYSRGAEMAEAAYRSHAFDPGSDSVLGQARLDAEVASGFARGFAHGAMQGDDQFAAKAAAGEYRGWVGSSVQVIAKGENFVIDKAYGPVASGVSAATGAASGAWHAGGRLLDAL